MGQIHFTIHRMQGMGICQPVTNISTTKIGHLGFLSDNVLSETEGIVRERHILLGNRPRSVWQGASPTLFFDYENEDENETNQSYRYFRHLPPEPLLSNCLAEGHFFNARSWRKNSVLIVISAIGTRRASITGYSQDIGYENNVLTGYPMGQENLSALRATASPIV